MTEYSGMDADGMFGSAETPLPLARQGFPDERLTLQLAALIEENERLRNRVRLLNKLLTQSEEKSRSQRY